jgi:flagellar biosynthesis protein FlhF
MKIKRFFAADMRTAIRQVRETLGPDSVILSNKSVDGGVELVAALDFDESALSEVVNSIAEEATKPSGVVTSFPGSDVTAERKPEVRGERNPSSQAAASPASRVEWSQDPLLIDMRREVHTLRRIVENELSGFTWREMGDHQPRVRELIRRLMGFDLHPAICQRIIERVGDFENPEQGWRKALYYLATELHTTGDHLLEEGGIVAVVGPTGVGKTTTIAKLAARFGLRQGNRHIALISADSYRIGAQEQLATYARILDVPMRSVANVEELNAALNALADKRLILIDTAGMSQRDLQLSEKLAVLQAGNRKVRTLLALSATTQQAALKQAIQAFSVARPEACILTKLDEAASLGGVLSAIIDTAMPLAYTTDGQRVPEDLHLARSHTLVSRAVNLGQQDGEEYSEEYLALALGGVRADAHG